VTVLQLSLKSVHLRSVRGKTKGVDPLTKLKRKKKPRQPTEQFMTCEDEIALIADYLSSNLRTRVLRSFEEHLNGCRDCTAFVQTYKKTIEVTRTFLVMRSLANRRRKLALRVPKGDGNRHQYDRPASFSKLNPSNELNWEPDPDWFDHAH
jgi:hypothetical protein